MRTKSTPPIKDLISSKRGIIFSLNLFNSYGVRHVAMESNVKISGAAGGGGAARGGVGTDEPLGRDLDDNDGDDDDDQSASSSQSKGQAKRNRTQTGDSLLLLSDDMMDVDMMDEDEDDGALIHSATLATTAAHQQEQPQQQERYNQNLNPNFINSNNSNNPLLSSSPLSSVGGGSKQGSSILDDDEEHDISTDLTTTSTTTSTSTSPKNGYDLSVAVHKVTSTALLYRMHKQKQEGKYKNGPVQINPTIWSKASLASYTNGGLASSLFPSSNPAANKLHTGEGPAYRKRKINQSASQAGECNWCGTRKTAQWRKGPTGARGLCNVRL